MTAPVTKYLTALEQWRRLDRDRDKLIRYAYRNGASAVQIAKATGIQRSRVYTILRRMGIEKGDRGYRAPYAKVCPECGEKLRATYLNTHRRKMHG